MTKSRRADIDGLRAIAILSVMIFHFNAAWLPGGFIGVDVFFVISAYLITNRIVDAIQKRQFSIRDFYVSRIKRIFPVSILVFFITVFLASQLNGLLLPNAKYILAFIFNLHTSNYFISDSKTNFFLQYWSLSIEEQFYLFWPLLLLPLLWSGTTRFSKMLKIYPLVLVSTIAVICFVLGIKWSMDPAYQANYYFMSIPRFGEMACGAFIALLPVIGDTSRLARLGVYVGMALVMFSCVFMGTQYFPGWRALLPCVGAALLLYCGTASSVQTTWLHCLLTRSSMRFVGYISYSLYLWHWLVFSVTRFVYGAVLPVSFFLPLVAVIFLLSAFTYYFVEQPCQQAKVKTHRVFTIFS